MVSLPTPVDGGRPGSAPIPLPLRISGIRLPRVPRLQLYPQTAWRRWVLRGLFSVPFAVLVVMASFSATVRSTPNGALLARVARIDWSSADVGWVRDVFPPVPTLLAIPGSPLVVGLAGAVVAGYLLQRLLEVLAQRRFSVLVGAVAILIVAANPLVAYFVASDTADFIGVALVALGLVDAHRFVRWRSTQAGFRSGVELMVAVLTTPLALPLVAAAAIVTFLLHREVESDTDRARRSAVVVVIFPAVSALATLTALTLFFGRDPLGFVERGTFERIPQHASVVAQLALGPVAVVLAAAAVAAVAIGVAVARVDIVAVTAVLLIGTIGAAVLGLSDVTMLVVVAPVAVLLAAVALLPRATSGPDAVVVFASLVGLGALSWVAAVQTAPVSGWLHVLASPW